MLGFQAINAAQPATDANRMNEVSPDGPRPVPHPAAFRSRSQPFETRELPARDWTLAKIVDRETRHGVIHYKTRWKSTTLDVSYIQMREDSSWVVRCGGADWLVQMSNEPTFNEHLGVFERQVTWQDTWHPTWEFVSARQSIVCWEKLNNPELAPPARDWWLYSHSISKYYDPVADYDPALRRDIFGDEIEPELHADYTFSLLEKLMAGLAIGENTGVPPATICKMLNLPVRQLLTFSESFVDARGSLPLHREEFVRAALVQVVGFAREDSCSTCRERREPLPFDTCVVLGNNFYGYVLWIGAGTGFLADLAL